ncbi:hypothetical protein ACFDR9_005601 [Janthinobacterium sp. CG_23.3]
MKSKKFFRIYYFFRGFFLSLWLYWDVKIESFYWILSQELGILFH